MGAVAGHRVLPLEGNQAGGWRPGTGRRAGIRDGEGGPGRVRAGWGGARGGWLGRTERRGVRTSKSAPRRCQGTTVLPEGDNAHSADESIKVYNDIFISAKFRLDPNKTLPPAPGGRRDLTPPRPFPARTHPLSHRASWRQARRPGSITRGGALTHSPGVQSERDFVSEHPKTSGAREYSRRGVFQKLELTQRALSQKSRYFTPTTARRRSILTGHVLLGTCLHENNQNDLGCKSKLQVLHP